MINLLPPEYKQTRKFARRNARLVRYIVSAAVGLTTVLLVTTGGFWYINLVLTDIQSQKSTLNERLSTENINASIQEFDGLAQRTKSILQILQKQVLFSKLIQKIAPVLPQGATLQDISLSDNDTALTLNFSLPTRESALTLQSNLQDPANELFEKADILSASCTTSGLDSVCGAEIRVLIGNTSQFLLYTPSSNQGAKK
jgi:Tfp pilus assembly protein PilN